MNWVTRHAVAFCCILLLNSCEDDPKPAEWLRFEKALKTSALTVRDTNSRAIVLWNDAACHGCKVKCVDLLLQHPTWHVIVIAPYSDRNLAAQLPRDRYWIDSFNQIGRYFYGINNLGMIRLKGNIVREIRDFSVQAMDSLEIELGRQNN
ncbi:hypothetical protein [Rurimicrobium arvi]|uniref:hypothetical protein n=1 Tax=Rurimicrobium arvi TaxID=2049916 RepID=UPI0031E049EC